MPAMLLIPKSVMIQNPRLNCLYYALMTVTLASYIAWWVHYRKFNKEVDIQNNIDLSAFPQISLEGLNTTFLFKMRDPICSKMQRVSNDVIRMDYEEMTCLPPCKDLNMMSKGQCISVIDMFKVEARDSIFFPTLIFRAEYDESAGASLKAHIVPYESHLGVGMSYNLKVETAPFFDLFFDKQTIHADSKVDILTVVMHGGQVKMVFTPDRDMHLSLHDIFKWSGTEGILDEPNRLAGMNPPTTRVTGVEFDFLVTCRNQQHRKNIPMLKQLPSHFRSWKHICQLEIIRSARGWAYFEEKIADPSLLSFPVAVKRFFGVRIRLRTAGSFEYVHWGTFIDAIIQLLVLCQLPMQIVTLVATQLLGSLSSIYSRVIQEPFGIRKQIGGLAIRLMANSATYLDLTDQQDGSGRWGISISRMRERLGASLSHQKDLDSDEINAMTSFCYESVVDWQLANRSEVQQIANIVTKDLRRLNAKDGAVQEIILEEGAAKEVILEEEYGQAMTNNEPLGFNDVVKLFDRDRRLTFLEKVFSPAYLLELRKHPKIEKGKPEHPMEQSRLQTPACNDDLSEAVVRFDTVSSMGASTQASVRVSSLETQKDEARQNLMRIQVLEEKGTTLEEQVLQLSRKYWELVETLSEQDVILRETLQSNTGNSTKCMVENFQLGTIEEQLNRKINASLAEREAAFNQQFEKLKKQIEEECSQMASYASELQYDIEALDMQYKALDLRLSSLCTDDLMTPICCNKARHNAAHQSSSEHEMGFSQQGTAMNLHDTSSESGKSGAIHANEARSLTNHNVNKARTSARQAKCCTSTEMRLSVNRVGVKQEEGERKEEADLDASQRSSRGLRERVVPRHMRWII